MLTKILDKNTKRITEEPQLQQHAYGDNFITSDNSIYKVNLIMMHLKLGDSVSGFVSTGQLCGAALLIAENTGTKCPFRDNFRHYILLRMIWKSSSAKCQYYIL